MDLKKYITSVPDFPVKGILYRDIQPLLADADAFTHACMQMSWMDEFPDYWVGIESEGSLEMEPGEGKIVLVDDVFATGGTMEAAEELAIAAGYDVIGKVCLLDIGLKNAEGYVKSLIKYE